MIDWIEITVRIYDRLRKALVDGLLLVVLSSYIDREGTNPLSGGVPTVRYEIGVRKGGQSLLKREDRCEGGAWRTRCWIRG